MYSFIETIITIMLMFWTPNRCSKILQLILRCIITDISLKVSFENKLEVTPLK